VLVSEGRRVSLDVLCPPRQDVEVADAGFFSIIMRRTLNLHYTFKQIETIQL
jgi:hypothetical protein